MNKKIIKFFLKILFFIDNFAYKSISSLAIKYENGIHPKHRIISYHDFFVSNILEREKVIDIGCGNGALAFDVAKKASYVKGIDINLKSIKNARKKYYAENIDYDVMDATKYIGDEKYDVAILSNVLEHIDDRIEFMRSIKKCAKRFLVRVPLINRDWLVLFKKELRSEWRLDSTHFTEFTEKSFKEEIEKAGFNIKKQSIQWGELWAELE